MAKDLEIEPFIQSKLAFANNNISWCFFFFLIDLHFLMLAIIAQIFNPIVELKNFLEILTKEAKAEMEMYIAVTTKTKVRKC